MEMEGLDLEVEEGMEIIDFDELQDEKQKPIGVYVKVNHEGCITDVNSDIFIKDFEGWIKIDEGYGDKFAHAQSCYYDRPLVDEYGNYLVKL